MLVPMAFPPFGMKGPQCVLQFTVIRWQINFCFVFFTPVKKNQQTNSEKQEKSLQNVNGMLSTAQNKTELPSLPLK